MLTVLLGFALWAPPRAVAQPCPPVPPTGPAPAWFEFQVETPARFVGADTTRPVPLDAPGGPDRESLVVRTDAAGRYRIACGITRQTSV